MSNINHFVAVGRAGSDPDVRYYESGRQSAKFSIAVNRPVKDAPPDWYPLDLWGKNAEVAANYVRKGDLVGIEGNLKLDTWTDRQTGESRQMYKIAVSKIRLLGRKTDNGDQRTHEEF